METSRDEGAAQAAEIAELLRALREEVGRLSERVALLEASRSPEPAATAATAATAGAPAAEEPSEEVMLVIAAAVAAFLGKRPRIRQVRVLDSRTWSHQGRVSVQASHTFSRG